MLRRMSIAVLSLIAGLSATYLHLYKNGVFGLSCSGGGCAKAIFSQYGAFLGVDVGLIGAIGYALILATTIVSLQPRFESARGPRTALLVLALGGFLFTLRLKYAEFFILETFCPWCAISAVAISVITVLAVIEWRTAAISHQPSAISS